MNTVPPGAPGQQLKLILIGCGKAKKAEPCMAQDLYTGPIFKARRAYAEASGCGWMIVSAKHELVSPFERLSPYNLTMKDLDPAHRQWWGSWIAHLLQLTMVTEVELHMGRDYAESLIPALDAVGIRHSWPVKGLSQGHQLQWYKQQREACV